MMISTVLQNAGYCLTSRVVQAQKLILCIRYWFKWPIRIRIMFLLCPCLYISPYQAFCLELYSLWHLQSWPHIEANIYTVCILCLWCVQFQADIFFSEGSCLVCHDSVQIGTWIPSFWRSMLSLSSEQSTKSKPYRRDWQLYRVRAGQKQ